jgi:hypothetical protein
VVDLKSILWRSLEGSPLRMLWINNICLKFLFTGDGDFQLRIYFFFETPVGGGSLSVGSSLGSSGAQANSHFRLALHSEISLRDYLLFRVGVLCSSNLRSFDWLLLSLQHNAALYAVQTRVHISVRVYSVLTV